MNGEREMIRKGWGLKGIFKYLEVEKKEFVVLKVE